MLHGAKPDLQKHYNCKGFWTKLEPEMLRNWPNGVTIHTRYYVGILCSYLQPGVVLSTVSQLLA